MSEYDHDETRGTDLQRTTRYQGAIVQDDCVLLIRYRDPLSERTYWLIPGGGQEPDESEEACVQREMREETNLEVHVERLLLDLDDLGGVYLRRKTYLCRVLSGVSSPGYEPGPPIPDGYGIIETGWFHLGRPETWGVEVHQDRITCSMLRHIQKALGYEANPMTPEASEHQTDFPTG
jgi:8-oxo-dGTP pyrophosphatase MutT (NUDIX family)